MKGTADELNAFRKRVSISAVKCGVWGADESSSSRDLRSKVDFQ